MHALSKSAEELAQDEIRACVDVHEPLRYSHLGGDQLPERRRIRFGVIVAARRLGLRGRDRFFDRRQRIFAQQKLDPLKIAAALLRYGANGLFLPRRCRIVPYPLPPSAARCAQR